LMIKRLTHLKRRQMSRSARLALIGSCNKNVICHLTFFSYIFIIIEMLN